MVLFIAWKCQVEYICHWITLCYYTNLWQGSIYNWHLLSYVYNSFLFCLFFITQVWLARYIRCMSKMDLTSLVPVSGEQVIWSNMLLQFLCHTRLKFLEILNKQHLCQLLSQLYNWNYIYIYIYIWPDLCWLTGRNPWLYNFNMKHWGANFGY